MPLPFALKLLKISSLLMLMLFSLSGYAVDTDNDPLVADLKLALGMDQTCAIVSNNVTCWGEGDGGVRSFSPQGPSSATWDIDANGQVDALTDGLLLLRHAFGVRGDALASGAVAVDSPLTASEIELSAAAASAIADVDGNGQVDALSDGLLLLRYLFGLSGDGLISGVVAADASRTTVVAITEYLDEHMPGADNSAPVITLLGSQTVSLQQGDSYNDLGATALDANDSEVAVTTYGAVGTQVGTYNITYVATDAAGNVATATRTVTVVASQAGPQKILVFSKTSGWRHDSIGAGQTMLTQIADSNDWEIEITEDSSQFNSDNLNQYGVVVWLNTTGEVLNSAQQTAFENYIESGGGYVGIHSASDTEYSWPWYGDLVGAYFNSHPQVQQATIHIEDGDHQSTSHLDATWVRSDEWYNYRENPRSNVNVLMNLDESSYNAGAGAMGSDHPIAWTNHIGAGRAFYTGLGHTASAYYEPDFIDHIKGALIWAGGLIQGTPQWTGPAPGYADFTTTVLGSAINQPMELDISSDGDIYVIGREGQFYAMENGTLTETSSINVDFSYETGLIGFALDPAFTSNRYAYFHYTDPNAPQHIISRMKINADHSLDKASEFILLTFPLQTDECCHVAGSMDFDSAGNLYIAVGDNTNPFESSGYTPIDERAGRSSWDAQKSSSNTNDLRGKILRIKPTANGYSIPQGNLFAGDSLRRPEIYTMGHRNPFRIAIDPLDDRLFWGDIGPDAGGSDPSRGPGGYDELNQTAEAGNFGWPYFSGDNEAYNDYNFATSTSGAKFNATNVINNSPNNTGATNLPDAQPAWVTLSHRALMVAGVYRWDSTITDSGKLPSYFDGKLIYWNFNNDEMFEASVDDSDPNLGRWLDASVMAGIIDGVISPHNNRLYLISFGGNCCGKPNDAGLLVEVEYTGDGAASGPVSSYAINVAGGPFTSADGTQYQADNYSSGGNSADGSQAIAGTLDDAVYRSHRWNPGGFSYNLPLEDGDYKLSLKFADTHCSSAGCRVFHINAEGSRIITNLDVVAAVGANTAYEFTAEVSVADGSLDVDFISKIENPMLSAISVSPVSEFSPGAHISLNAAVNSQYVSVVNGSLVASSEEVSETEIFLMVDAGDGLIALKSLATENYISVLGNGVLSVNASTVTNSEKFSLVDNSDGSYALKAMVNDRFVSAENYGNGALVANRTSVQSWEQFNLSLAEVCEPNYQYAIPCRPNAQAYLKMPATAQADMGNLPALLSQTGAFSNVVTLTPSDSLIPYEPIAKLWSDRAEKARWVAVPSGKKVVWDEHDQWQWPAGTVFVKHFELPTNEDDPSILRRLETRLIVMSENQQVYGATYKWRSDNSDADLLTDGLAEDLTISSAAGDWVQTWNYPSPTDCLSCHNDDAKAVLGLKTAALNGNYQYQSNITANQLVTFNHLGIFASPLNALDIAGYPAHAAIDDNSTTLEHRVRSYWDINCGSCHGPQGIASLWDARYETPLAYQGVVRGPLSNQRDYLADYGLSDPYVVDPGNIDNSMLYIRDKSVDSQDRMPPLGRLLEDTEYINVLEQWINSLD
ncbi:MAG: ThuA domain-containing protein [Porticoccaceae bacterium]|nr:ThuA domain-containing protein [Porticoccaceae bacterium]